MNNPVNLVHRVKKKKPATFGYVGVMFANRAEIRPWRHAYARGYILSSDFCILSSSQYSNPSTFTGRRLDLIDAGVRV